MLQRFIAFCWLLLFLLLHAAGSHSDFALPYWNSPEQQQDQQQNSWTAWDYLEDRYPKDLVDYMPFQLGDLSVHSGWTLHCSSGGGDDCGGSGDDRIALAVTFVDSDAEIRSDWQTKGDNEDRWSYEEWCQHVKPRRKINHELVPVVWPPPDSSE